MENTFVDWIVQTRKAMDPMQLASAKHWVVVYRDPAIEQFVAYETSDPERFSKDYLASRTPNAQFAGLLPMPARKAAEEFVSNFRFFMPLCQTLNANVKATKPAR